MNKQQLELGNELTSRIKALEKKVSDISKLIDVVGKDKGIYVTNYDYSLLVPNELRGKILESIKEHYETELSQSKELFEKL